MSTVNSTLDPWLSCEPHLNSRLLLPMLRFYETRFGRRALEKVVAEMGTTLEVLQDPDRWFSTELFLELTREMSRATGDPDIAYKAGRALIWPGMLGAERMLLAGLANPSMAYSKFPSVSARMCRTNEWTVSIRRRGRATATVHFEDPAHDAPEFCRNRLAVLEAIPEGFSLPLARVDHHSCSHRGDPDCIYEVHWAERSPLLPIGWILAVALSLTSAVLVVLGSTAAVPVLAATAAVALLTGLATATSQRRVIEDTDQQNRSQIDELQALLKRNDRRVQELQAIAGVVEATSDKRDEQALIESVLNELRSKLDYDRALLLRVSQDGTRLGAACSSGFGENRVIVEQLDVSMQPEGSDDRLFGNILSDGASMLANVDEDFIDGLLPGNRELIRMLGSSSFVAAPVLAPGLGKEQEALALLVVDRTRETSPLSLRDRDLVGSVASALGTAISNVRHFRRVQDELLINQKFRQYLAPQAVEAIRADPAARLRLGGEARQVAIMLTDIAQFTETSSRLDPEEVVRGLNKWFAITDPIIRSCNGIVDKRMGDGILIVFLDEQSDRDGRHPVQRAAAAALGMLNALEESRGRLSSEAPGFANMQIRHAIHFGKAIVGNMGSEERMEYTVIGDAVNTCARLEEVTPAGVTWMSGEAVDAVSAHGLSGLRLERTTTLRGRTNPTAIWSLDPEGEATASGTWLSASSTASITTSLVAQEAVERQDEADL